MAFVAVVFITLVAVPVFASETVRFYDIPLTWADPDCPAPQPFLRVKNSVDGIPRLYLPVRYFAERKGLKVEYVAEKGYVRVGENVVVVNNDSTKGVVDSDNIGKILLPQDLGKKVIYDGLLKNDVFYVTNDRAWDVFGYLPFENIRLGGIEGISLPSLPVEGNISSPFGYRADPWGGDGPDFHNGIDIAADFGTPVRAVAPGVAKVGYDPEGWGNFVIVRDGAVEYHYYHLSEMAVQTGDRVEAGQMIGYVGSTGASTGPHLHFAVKTAVDPLLYLEKEVSN